MANNDFNYVNDDVYEAPAIAEEILIDEAATKDIAREELNQQIEEFLAKGGAISQVPTDVMADPPKKPTSNYGSQPI